MKTIGDIAREKERNLSKTDLEKDKLENTIQLSIEDSGLSFIHWVGIIVFVGIALLAIFGQRSDSTLVKQVIKVETINCGLKTITLKNGKIDQIRHGDGTVHSGHSISNHWSYDGSSIKHKLMDKRTQCGTKPKSRDEIIAELSSRFTKNPSLHGMDKDEAQLMANYTTNLMKTDKACYLLVDASKSTQRKEMYFIDCNDHSNNSHRYWVSSEDLKAGNFRPPTMPIPEAEAINICNSQLRSKTINPSTYNPALLTGTTSRVVKSNGRNIIEINFSAKSAIGVESEFRGRCILESGALIEAVIEQL